MMKKWKLLLSAWCAVAMFLTMPSMSVLAEELVEEIIITEVEKLDEALETADPTGENATDNADAPIAEERADLEEAEELVGVAAIQVGDGVTATIDADTGAVSMYSEDGTLWEDWLSKSGIKKDNITSICVVYGKMYLPTNSSYLFKSCINLSKIDFDNIDTSKMMSCDHMFWNCSRLTELDLSNFDTSNVTDMNSMFATCSGMTSIDLGGFDTSHVTDMHDMFRGCSKLTALNLSGFNTSNVDTMECMFGGCNSLGSLNVSSFDTSHVTNMSNMFSACSGLTYLDVTGFDTSNVTTMQSMFNGCYALLQLDLSNFDTSKVTSMSAMFAKCRSLTDLDLSSFDTSKVGSMSSMFYDCFSLEKLNLSSFDTLSLSSVTDMFYNCTGITFLDLSGFNMNNILHTLSYWLPECKNLQILRTPKEYHSTLAYLPCKMYDSSGKGYSALPKLTKSIVLARTSLMAKEYETSDFNICNILTIDLLTTSYVYDGNEKKPSVVVKVGNETLACGTDYIISFTDNINAGTAVVKVTGIGNYKGEKSVTFTIDKATAKLDFIESAVVKNTTDMAFTNTLIKMTDGTVTFESSNTEVAIVNSTNGLVTIKGAGTAIITAASAEGKNYKAGNNAYSLTVKAPAPTPTPKPTASGFSDVQDPSHPYYKAIYWAADAGITKGYDDGTFGINKSCTRGEMIMFLWRFAHKPAPVYTSKTPFSDVPKYHTFYKAILWAYQKGITKGYGDGTFGVDRKVTRGESMMFFWRVKGKPAPKAVANSPFKDVPKTHVFYKAILWGAQEGITKGYTSGAKKGTFGINENCTRGHIVTFLYRAK